MNTNVAGRAVSDANDLTTEIAKVTEFRQNERNFQNRGKGISEIEGKGAMGSAERGGSRASFNRGKVISEIEGKGAMGSAERGGSRPSFNRGKGISEKEGKATARREATARQA